MSAVEPLFLYETENQDMTLAEVRETFNGDPASSIPFLVRLLENPKSPFSLPGDISLGDHDAVHFLLNQDMSNDGEAFVIGFTMGNASKTRFYHLMIFEFASRFLYPDGYRLSREQIRIFRRGVEAGRQAGVKDINRINFSKWDELRMKEIRDRLGVKARKVPPELRCARFSDREKRENPESA